VTLSAGQTLRPVVTTVPGVAWLPPTQYGGSRSSILG